MAWLELKIDTLPSGIEAAAAALTAAGFEDLVLEDQAEFETFLEENREYWDYIDESLQEKLGDHPIEVLREKVGDHPIMQGVEPEHHVSVM